MDVFHGGRILSVVDCQRIVSHYGLQWRDSFSEPLSNTKIIERVFNNLSHCHHRESARKVPFQSDLNVRLHLLSEVHSKTPVIARRWLGQCIETLSSRLLLRKDLFRVFNLLDDTEKQQNDDER